MNRKNLIQKIGGVVLAASLLFGVAMMSSNTVQAQRRGGGFHGGGFHGGGFRGGFGGRGVIWAKVGLGYGNPFGYFRYPYGYDSPFVFCGMAEAGAEGLHGWVEASATEASRG